jgi:predicted component of type VI protein secretion system
MAGETLKITGGNAAGQDINLDQELVIGRSTPGLGSLGGDSEISRVHARVFHDPSGRLTVEDLGSTNGTFVNGNRISGQQALNPGDEVRVGQTTMSVEGGGAAGATTVGNVVPAPVPTPAAAPAAAEPPTQALPPTGQQPAAPPPAPPYGGGPVGGPPPRAGGGPNRNLLIAIAAAVVVALVVAGLAIGGVFGGSDDDKSKTTAQTTSTSTPTTATPTVTTPQPPASSTPPSQGGSGGGGSGGGGYSSTFKTSFVSSCAKSGSLSRSQCQCIINKAEDQYSLPDFISAVGKAQRGSTPPKLRQIFVSCANA